MVQKVAREIAAGLGYEWDTLYEGKAEWIADRGSRHDINTPYKPDFIEAARAAIEAMREPTEAMLIAAEAIPIMADTYGQTRDEVIPTYTAMISAALAGSETDG